MSKLITPRAEDYSRWYNDLVLQGKLADYSPVRGCMVIRPHGYAVWEKMQAILDARLPVRFATKPDFSAFDAPSGADGAP